MNPFAKILSPSRKIETHSMRFTYLYDGLDELKNRYLNFALNAFI
mgnify:CR=1 FL=1